VPRTAQAASQAKRIAINSGETTKH
jgi:hypothetical protein